MFQGFGRGKRKDAKLWLLKHINTSFSCISMLNQSTNLQTRRQRTCKHFEKLITILDCQMIITRKIFTIHMWKTLLRLYLVNLKVGYWVLPALLHNIIHLHNTITVYKSWNFITMELEMKHNVAHEKRTMFRHYILDLLIFSQWQKLTDRHKKKKYHATLTFTLLHKLPCSMLIHHIKLPCLWTSYHNLLAASHLI